jgi:hypothetical protein
MDSVTKRVVQCIESLTENKKQFSEKTGISAVKLSHLSSGRNAASLQIIVDILETFPELSADWLILGSGGMYRDEEETKELIAIGKIIENFKKIQNEHNIKSEQMFKSIESYLPEREN